VLAGTAGSLLAASTVAHNAAQRSHTVFAASAAEIAGTLRLAIQHENDLIVDAKAFVLGNPHASEAMFAQWAGNVNALRSYPELQGFGESRIVSLAQLPAFAAHPVDEVVGASSSQPFTLIPPGTRAFYCFTVLGLSRNVQASLPPGLDLCSGVTGRALLATRSSGRDELLPLTARGTTTLSLAVPIYREGSLLSTGAARRAAFVGWVGMSIVPGVILRQALRGHPDMAVALRYGGQASNILFRSGAHLQRAQTAATSFGEGWTILTSGIVAGGGISGDAFAPLIAGVALSLLLGTLIFMLGTGRARSMALVEERTDELRFQALHDSLTGLPNRALIMDRIEQLLARNRRNGNVGAALYVDIDDFKNVNDSLGHEAGDRLLESVALRMEGTLRGADTIGRMGGDEFVVLIDGGDVAVAPELVAERILDVMGQPFELVGASMPLVVNTSIGIAVGDRASGGELLRDADVALYQAKAGGKNRYEFFRPEMQTDIGRRIDLEFRLRSALAANQFRLVYQPIYNLDDLSIVGVEALLRWEHPTQGVLQPDEFIPVLEQTGQIREVGHWVLRQACSQMALWHARGNTLDVSVNVSARQLDDDNIVGFIRDALQSSGLVASSLIIEVTETALMRDTSAALRRLQVIKDLGVLIAVDDFGTGYSSLAYLQQFPVDCIKIDKSFTNAIATSPESKALVRTLVQLGKDLGLKTLAEGVETTGELDLLRINDVDEIQGFLLSRPLDAETLESQLFAPSPLVTRATTSEAT
jgi:diguanylate cyclase (GGDEF)-like protein